MYNKTLVQPEELSDEEWDVLQHLALLTDCFYMADASLGFTEISTMHQLGASLRFAKHFERLKTTGYLAIQPMTFADAKELSSPLYTLSVLGKKATHR